MLVEPPALLAALRLPPDAAVDVEPLGEAPGSPERVEIRTGSGTTVVTVRRSPDPELARNNIAVLGQLSGLGYTSAPRLLAVVDEAAVEEAVEGVTALGILPPAGSCEAAVDALAALHMLPLREGLRWELERADLLSPDEVPLHRLGFASAERAAARPYLVAARDALLAGSIGFCHGQATAEHVVLRPDAAWLVNFEQAGFGVQLFDLAAFLLTAGLYAEQRRTLALRYAAARGMPADGTTDLVDLAGLVWGLTEQLSLPRRMITTFGDDTALERLNVMAARIDAGIRDAAGAHPAAAGIRAALWR